MGSRRKKSSAAEDIVDLVAMLPWWVDVVLALGFYLWLQKVATTPALLVTQPGQLGRSAVALFWQQLALYGQYILPLLSLAGAGLSAWRRHARRKLAAETAASPAADALDGMSWQRFELLVGEAFRQRGYRVLENGGGGADGGVDLVLSKGGEKFLVQCKQWRANKVGVEVVRQLYGVMAARGAAGGFVVTSGRFTQEAQDFARGRNVVLIDGTALHRMLQPAAAAPAAASAEPACPTCSQPMIRRVARQGANAGKAFWGCSAYPGCRGTRAISD